MRRGCFTWALIGGIFFWVILCNVGLYKINPDANVGWFIGIGVVGFIGFLISNIRLPGE
jgi:hypothetical protein